MGLADGLVSLVHAEPGQMSRLAVDEKAGAVDADSADTEGLPLRINDLIAVVEGDFSFVEVAPA